MNWCCPTLRVLPNSRTLLVSAIVCCLGFPVLVGLCDGVPFMLRQRESENKYFIVFLVHMTIKLTLELVSYVVRTINRQFCVFQSQRSNKHSQPLSQSCVVHTTVIDLTRR